VTTDELKIDSAIHGHSHCLLCGRDNPTSFGLSFAMRNGVAHARFQAYPGLRGYDGLLHGGVIASLLDAAMTHCLFHQDVQAVTGDLRVRFVRPVACHMAVDLSAWIVSATPPLYRLRAELACEDTLMAWAEAKFMRRGSRS
jgi:acyl-coenzyme A thioesterase PaaI-like protein